jgi:hypothetical protein
MTTSVGIGRGSTLVQAAVMNAVAEHLAEHVDEGMADYDRPNHTAGAARKISLRINHRMSSICNGAGHFWPGCFPALPSSDRLEQPTFCTPCHNREGGSSW